MLASFPTEISSWVSQAVLQAPCWIPSQETIEQQFGTPADPPPNPCDDVDDRRLLDEEERGRSRRRQLKKKGGKSKSASSDSSEQVTDECEATWDYQEYYTALHEIKDKLSSQDYKEFVKEFKNWKRGYGSSWKYGGAWQAAFQRILCEIDNTFPECVPEDWKIPLAFSNFLTENNINASFIGDGANTWADIVNSICAEFGADSQICLYYQYWLGTCPDCFQPISTKYETDLVQNYFTRVNGEFDDDFNTTGWYSDPKEIDLSSIGINVRYMDAKDDQACDYQANSAIADGLPSVANSFTWRAGQRTHSTMQFDNDEEMWSAINTLLIADYGGKVEGLCGDIDFWA